MSRIKPQGPPSQRAESFNSDGYQKTFRDFPCESCGINDDTIVGAHFNMEGGGMGYRAPGVVAGLCKDCHDIADGRTNAPEKERWKIWGRVLAGILRNRARVWGNQTSHSETGEK